MMTKTGQNDTEAKIPFSEKDLNQRDLLGVSSGDSESSGKSLMSKLSGFIARKQSKETVNEIVEYSISIDGIDGIVRSGKVGRARNIVGSRVPVFGILSYSQELPGTETSVTTNVPSEALVKSSSIGNRSRYYASFGQQGTKWPINVALPMVVNRQKTSGYDERKFIMKFSLMSGGEFIELGAASISLCGDEIDEPHVIPIGYEKKESNIRLTSNKKKNLSSRSASFNKDASCKYSLKHANLRVTVTAERTVPKISSSECFVKDMSNDSVYSTSKTMSADESTLFSAQPDKENSEINENTPSNLNTQSNLNTKNKYNFFNSDAGRLSTENSGFDKNLSKFNTKKKFNFFGGSSVKYDTSTGSSSVESPSNRSSSDESSMDGSSVFDSIGEESTIRTVGDESTILDNVSLGTIQFKDICNSDLSRKESNEESCEKSSTESFPSDESASNGSSTFDGVTIGDDSTLLENISIGTIHFKGMSEMGVKLTSLNESIPKLRWREYDDQNGLRR